MKQFSSLTFFILSFFISIQAQRKYYFGSKGMGGGNGTKQQPFTSLQRLSHLKLQPGDTVFFHAGETIVGNISMNDIHGTKKQNIVFTSYDKGKSIIDGGNKQALVLTT